jgi:hypothetical protein
MSDKQSKSPYVVTTGTFVGLGALYEAVLHTLIALHSSMFAVAAQLDVEVCIVAIAFIRTITHLALTITEHRTVPGLARVMRLPLIFEALGCAGMSYTVAGGNTGIAVALALAGFMSYVTGTVILGCRRHDDERIPTGPQWFSGMVIRLPQGRVVHVGKIIVVAASFMPGLARAMKSRPGGKVGAYTRFTLVGCAALASFSLVELIFMPAVASTAPNRTSTQVTAQPHSPALIRGCDNYTNISEALHTGKYGGSGDDLFRSFAQLGAVIARCVTEPYPLHGFVVARFSGGTGGDGLLIERGGHAADILHSFMPVVTPLLGRLAYLGPWLRLGLGSMYELIYPTTQACGLVQLWDDDDGSLRNIPQSVAFIALGQSVPLGALPLVNAVKFNADGTRTYLFDVFVADPSQRNGLRPLPPLAITYHPSAAWAQWKGVDATDTDACPVAAHEVAAVANELEASVQAAPAAGDG